MIDEAGPIKLWLVEDDASYRNTVAGLINSTKDMDTKAVLGSCMELVHHLDTHHPPDVVLQDIGLPDGSGVDCVRRLKMYAPDAKIIMLTVHEDEGHIFEALCAGASGYLIKHTSPARILNAIREVRQGGVLFSPSIARRVMRHFEADSKIESYGLTDREREILRLLAEGRTQKEIAEFLYLSPHTVESHMRHVYSKLHVRNGTAAVSKAIRERLI